MYKSIALLAHLMVLLSAFCWTHSTSGFLLAGCGLMLLLDRYTLRFLPWSPVMWKKELILRAGSWLAGTAGFYFMRPGLVPFWEAGYRGVMVCLATALLEQVVSSSRRLGRSKWRSVCVNGTMVVLLVLLIPVVGALHPLHTVLAAPEWIGPPRPRGNFQALQRHAIRRRFLTACKVLGLARQQTLTIHHGRHTFISHARELFHPQWHNTGSVLSNGVPLHKR